MFSDVIVCYGTLLHVLLDMIYCGMTCYVMLCFVIAWYVSMWCYVILFKLGDVMVDRVFV